jgi:hypothetical protein
LSLLLLNLPLILARLHSFRQLLLLVGSDPKKLE